MTPIEQCCHHCGIVMFDSVDEITLDQRDAKPMVKPFYISDGSTIYSINLIFFYFCRLQTKKEVLFLLEYTFLTPEVQSPLKLKMSC